jgi:hypothetical protein
MFISKENKGAAIGAAQHPAAARCLFDNADAGAYGR